MSESLNVWKFECIKVWMSESLNVWKSECLKVWMSSFFKAWTLGIWRKSRTKASFSMLDQVEFEGCLARKLRFQSLNKWNLKEVLRFQCLSIWNLKEFSHEMRFCEIADARNAVFCMTKLSQMMCGEACPADGFGTRPVLPESWSDRPRRLPVLASLSYLQPSKIQGSLARKLQFQSLNAWNLKEVSNESFDFKAWSLGIWRKSIVSCNSVCADGLVIAASKLLGAAAACVILSSLAAGHRKSYWKGRIKAAIVICHVIFSNLTLVILLWKSLGKSASKSSFFCSGVEIRFWSCNFWRRWAVSFGTVHCRSMSLRTFLWWQMCSVGLDMLGFCV